MARNFASEKRALGICDRCGLTYKLKNLIFEYENRHKTNLRVCRECKDGDHPQYRLGEIRTDDPQSLRNARPDTGESASRDGDNVVYDFMTTVDGLVGNEATLAWNSNSHVYMSALLGPSYNDSSIGATYPSQSISIDADSYNYARMRYKVVSVSTPYRWGGAFLWSTTSDDSFSFTEITSLLNPGDGSVGLQYIETSTDHTFTTGDYVYISSYTGGAIDEYTVGKFFKVIATPASDRINLGNPIDGDTPSEANSASGGSGIVKRASQVIATDPLVQQFGEEYSIATWSLCNESNWDGTIDSFAIVPLYDYGYVLDIDYIKFEEF